MADPLAASQRATASEPQLHLLAVFCIGLEFDKEFALLINQCEHIDHISRSFLE
jgi:hypothetical protein